MLESSGLGGQSRKDIPRGRRMRRGKVGTIKPMRSEDGTPTWIRRDSASSLLGVG